MNAMHPFLSRARELGRPLILGHRGANATETENTMQAFTAARTAGADGIELDVQMCATGEVLVFHDPDLSRMAGRGERISSMPWNQLRRVRIGGGLPIPTLDQVLAEFDDPGFVVNIEIKSPRLGRAGPLIDRVLACVEVRHAAERVVLSSFDPFAIARIRRKAPRLATGLLFHRDAPVTIAHSWRVPRFRPSALHPEYTLITGAKMSYWTQRGLAVIAWTVDSLVEVQRLTGLGVHAIITNDPARVRQSFT